MPITKDKYCNYIVLDCETGGTSSSKNPITQLAAILIDGKSLHEMDRYTNFIQPYGEELGYVIQQEALDYTGITRAQIAAGIHIKQMVSDLIELTEKARAHNKHVAYKPLVVGHNVQFDIGFLVAAFQYCKQDFYKHFQPDYFCTMRLSQAKHYPDSGDYKYNLEASCERAGVELLDGHDALNDTIATKELYVSFIRTLRESSFTSSSNNEEEVEQRFRDTFQFEI